MAQPSGRSALGADAGRTAGMVVGALATRGAKPPSVVVTATTAEWNVFAIEFTDLTQESVLVPGNQDEAAIAPLYNEDATTAPAAGLE
ncbi:hypothetical protein [Polyangium sp. 15x6]|uniref:hypothetical protein n=1 Tax=Polyangium sp. 15x6 TaxID=3042687 RepID=UPI00249C39D8|nr:hypothetical protein [Polyangium sp. 15x6]MDI3288187.1 hypothetical protein [Polyangium sp. 15x6]